MSNNDSGRLQKDTESDRELEELFRHTGPRERPPEAGERELRRALFEEWNAVTGRRIFRRRLVGAAAGLALIAIVSGALLRGNIGPELVPVAHVERVVGMVALGGGDLREDRPAMLGEAVTPGSVLWTGQGQVALRLAGDGSLRLAADTRLKVISATEAELVEGRLYFDSEAAAPGSVGSRPRLIVHTPAGIVRDVGTQFLARFDGDRLEVGVREGRVDVMRDDERATAAAGDRLIISQRGSDAIRRGSIERTGEDWAWAESLAPPFDIDGRYLFELLEWVADQTGRKVQYANAGAEGLARGTLLHGSVDLEPLSKLTAVLATTDLAYRIDGETILISVK